MTPQELVEAALWFPEAVETEPYEPGVLVYKVRDKSFAILQGEQGDRPAQVTLKCDPALALELRDRYPAVVPGYHVNKRHWNTVVLDGTVPDDELIDMLRHSYERVVAGLRVADRERLLAVLGEERPPIGSGA